MLFAIAIALVFVQTNSVPYDQNTSIDILYYARIAQCASYKIEAYNCTPCKYYPNMTNITIIKNAKHGTQAVTMYDPVHKNIVLAFRGTHGLIGWFWNIDAFFVDYPQCAGCRVHQGFYTDYLVVRQQVLESVYSLTELFPEHLQIIVTGHSLGAALSTLAVLDII